MLLVYFHCVGIILPLEKSLHLHLNKSENSSPKDALLDDIPLLSEICVVWYVAEVSSWFFYFCEILGYFASLLLIFTFKVLFSEYNYTNFLEFYYTEQSVKNNIYFILIILFCLFPDIHLNLCKVVNHG